MSIKQITSIFIVFFCLISSTQAQIYVDVNATGANNGTSWADAYTDLQPALTAAVAGDIINVGVGTYFPSQDINGSTSVNSRLFTFLFNKDIEIHGGFVGGVQMCDTANATVLSGDIGIVNDYSDNTYNVCYGQNLTNAFIIDCITIDRGVSEATSLSGAAWFNDGEGAGNSSNPTFQNCYFKRNLSGNGGALFNNGANGGEASPVLNNCIFKNNAGEFGGAMYNAGEYGGVASALITDCQFISNVSGEGGALYNYAESGISKPIVSQCVFIDNFSGNGGAVYIYGSFGDGSTVMSNCTFTNNQTDGNGGAIYADAFNGVTVQPEFNQCTFTGNQAMFRGGAIHLQASSPLIDGCVFTGNQAGDSGGAVNCNGSQGVVSSPTIKWSDFEQNTATNNGGALRLNGFAGTSDATVEHSKFIENSSNDGGAVHGDGSVGQCISTFENCLFSRNTAINDGGAAYFLANTGTTQPTFSQCSFSRNHASNLGSVISLDQNITGGVCAGQIYNSVSHGQNGIVIYVAAGSSFSGSNNIFENGWTTLWNFTSTGVNYGGIDPLYNDPLMDDLTLQLSSPAIDAGNNTYAVLPVDLANSPRIDGPNVDLGAYEFDPCPVKVYVDMDATGSNNGRNWTDAFVSFQDGIDLARSCNVDTIWVAEGTYIPSKTNSGSAANPNDRFNTFFIDFDVVIQGGFQGFETHESQRDWVTYTTTLSGNVGSASFGDNCYSVVEYSTVTNASELDGFTISGGRANEVFGGIATGMGGGILILGSPLIRNCILTGNYARNGGGAGAYFQGTSQNPAFINCEIVNNSGGVGAGVYLRAIGSGTVNNSIIQNCRFLGNSGINGGGLFLEGNASSPCSATISNCIFWDNDAFSGAGAQMLNASGDFINCSFTENTGVSGKLRTGGAIGVSSFTNCILWDNYPQLHISGGAQPFVMTDCIVFGGYASGTNILNVDPLFLNPATGDLRLTNASPAINIGLSGMMNVDTYDVDLDGNTTELIDVDLDLNPRVVGTMIDLGALEFLNVVALDETSVEQEVVVYPNPLNGDVFSIKHDFNGPVDVTIHNAVGQVMMKTTLTESQFSISSAGWETGIYFVNVNGEKRKLVKAL